VNLPLDGALDEGQAVLPLIPIDDSASEPSDGLLEIDHLTFGGLISLVIAALAILSFSLTLFCFAPPKYEFQHWTSFELYARNSRLFHRFQMIRPINQEISLDFRLFHHNSSVSGLAIVRLLRGLTVISAHNLSIAESDGSFKQIYHNSRLNFTEIDVIFEFPRLCDVELRLRLVSSSYIAFLLFLRVHAILYHLIFVFSCTNHAGLSCLTASVVLLNDPLTLFVYFSDSIFSQLYKIMHPLVERTLTVVFSVALLNACSLEFSLLLPLISAISPLLLPVVALFALLNASRMEALGFWCLLLVLLLHCLFSFTLFVFPGDSDFRSFFGLFVFSNLHTAILQFLHRRIDPFEFVNMNNGDTLES
jgi:hypothetical protein